MRTNKLRCYSQESFRRELIKRDQHCILSGLSAEVSEAAHIVNKEYLETDNKELRFTKQNGILLNSCLHKEFDLHFWTVQINPDSGEQQKNDDTLEIKCDIKLYPPAIKKKKNQLKLAIFDYESITIPRGCIPFFNIRNKIVEQKFYNPHSYSEDVILQHIKSEFTSSDYITQKEIIDCNVVKGTRKKTKSKSNSKSIKKKRYRYTKIETTFIREWVRTFKLEQRKPNVEERKQFSENIGIDDKLFESRFVKYWNNTSV